MSKSKNGELPLFDEVERPDGFPDHWEVAKLGDLTTKVNSGATPKGGKESYKSSGTPLIRSMNVHFDGFRDEGVAFLDDDQAEGLRNATVEANDVLLNITGASIGRVTTAPQHMEGARVNQHVCIVRTEDALESKFLSYFLSSPTQQAMIMRQQTGATRQALTKGKILAFDIPVPPFNEQKRIVSKIEELFSDLDSGVSALERARANLRRYRASVLKSAVEGRLTAAWRSANPGVEPASELLARILRERRQRWEQQQLATYESKGKKPPKNWQSKYKEPEEPNPAVIAQREELPYGWVWATIDQLADVGTGTTPKRSDSRYYVQGTIPWVTSGAVNEPFVTEGTEQVTEFALEDTNLKLYPKHTLIVALYGEGKTRGKVSELLIEATINQALGSLVMHESAIPVRRYLKLFLDANYIALRRKAAGGMQPNLNLGLLKSTLIALPPTNEQSEIVDEVESSLSVADATDRIATVNCMRGDRLRQSVLKDAFEGKLVKQNPEDEPAAEFLKRLKELEKTKSKDQSTKTKPKGSKMPKPRKRIPILEVLKEHSKGMAPNVLFDRAGFKREKDAHFDEFYSELDKCVSANKVTVQKQNDSDFLIRLVTK